VSMWRPPERIRHDPVPGMWPTVDEAAGSRLFAPVEIGGLQFQARTWVPAMVPWRATDDGVVSDREKLDEAEVQRSSDGKRRLIPPAWSGSS